MGVSRTKVKVPDWARDAVWYQVFPERFRNGCPASNPKPEDLAGEVPQDWDAMPWGAEWYGQEPWEGTRNFYHSVYERRYGGDLLGLREKLDYLQELGITALYLNPVFTAPSLHKYDASCFHHVDPTFGPDRAGDLRALAAAKETEDPATWIWTAADRCLLALIKDVHARGMRIILDGVFNHTGRRFFAFEDLLQNGRASRYRDWFSIKRWRKDGTFSYRGWFDHAALPEFARTEEDLASPVANYIFDITRRWMDPDSDGDPSDGIDGWRLDVAYCVPKGFWRRWRRHVKGLNPEAYITGEIVDRADEYFEGDLFDAVMNYMWLYPTVEFFSPSKRPLSANTFRKKLDILMEAYPLEVGQVLQNLLDSHDVGRILTVLANPDIPMDSWESYFDATRAKRRKRLLSTAPPESAYAALRQMVIFQMTYVGAPMLYYGTEVGMWGANDPDNRQPMWWDDIPCEPETRSHTGTVGPHPRAADQRLRSFFQRAIRLRKEHAVLRRGELEWLATSDERLLAYRRFDEEAEVRVYLNASDAPVTVENDALWEDLWERKSCPYAKGQLTLEPRQWLVVRCVS